MIEVYLRLRVLDREWIQRESRAHHRIDRSAEIRKIPPLRREIPDHDVASVILKGNHGSVGTKTALIVRGR